MSWHDPMGVVSPWTSLQIGTLEDSELHRWHYAWYNYDSKNKYSQWLLHMSLMRTTRWMWFCYIGTSGASWPLVAANAADCAWQA